MLAVKDSEVTPHGLVGAPHPDLWATTRIGTEPWLTSEMSITLLDELEKAATVPKFPLAFSTRRLGSWDRDYHAAMRAPE